MSDDYHELTGTAPGEYSDPHLLVISNRFMGVMEQTSETGTLMYAMWVKLSPESDFVLWFEYGFGSDPTLVSDVAYMIMLPYQFAFDIRSADPENPADYKFSYLEQTETVTGPTKEEIRQEMDSNSTKLAQIPYLQHIGPGAVHWSYDLYIEGTTTGIADAEIWITTDLAGTNVIRSGRTDQNGRVTFDLDVGTVYVWRKKAGYDFVNPDEEIIT